MISSTRFMAAVTVSIFIAVTLSAETIVLKNGDVVEGTIILRDEKQVVVSGESGVSHYAVTSIAKIQENGHTVKLDDATAPSVFRLPTLTATLATLNKQTWVSGVEQIPATVIDKGFMRNVPYVSYRIGKDYELNVYGDLDNPACIEIGVYRSLLENEDAKTNCLNFISALLPTQEFQAAIHNLNHKKDLAAVSGLTLEITPPETEDSYGGWWMSVYSESALNASRASAKEIARISVPTSNSTNSNSSRNSEWSQNQLDLSRRIKTASTNVESTPTPSPTPNYISPNYTTPDNSSGGDRVYVHGYYRKNGTYVNSYTRSRPSK